MKHKLLLGSLLALSVSSYSHAESVNISLTKLTGTVAQGTGVFKADLSSINFDTIKSITLYDSNSKTGGSPGEVSGFDFDGIKLSYTDANTAFQAKAATAINAFDFSDNGVYFSAGTQRAPVDSKLLGTDATGNKVDYNYASLDKFDAVYFAEGSVSLGDGGKIGFNLIDGIAPDGLFLYIGEVGSNGETLSGNLVVSTEEVPLPAAAWLFGSALMGLIARKKVS